MMLIWLERLSTLCKNTTICQIKEFVFVCLFCEETNKDKKKKHLGWLASITHLEVSEWAETHTAHSTNHTHTHAPFRAMARADKDSVSCQASHLPDCPDLKVEGRVGFQSGADVMTNSLLPLTGRAHTILLSQLGVLALLNSRESCQKIFSLQLHPDCFTVQ